jgi:retinol dehydrogenase-12
MTSQTHVVTGATDGIGLQTAKLLAQRGAHVLVHGRAEEKARKAVEVLSDKLPDARFTPVWGDLGRLAEVRTLAEQVRHHAPVLDGLVNNAGVFMKAWSETVDGFETTFQVNHLSHFLLTSLLLPELKAAPQGRVVNVSSMAHARGRVDLGDLDSKKRFDGYDVYALSKLLNVHFTHELARRLEGTRVTTYALHPGVITTKLLRTGFGMGGASVETGALTSVYCATEAELVSKTGRYFSDSREAREAPQASNPALERALWDESARRAGLS